MHTTGFITFEKALGLILMFSCIRDKAIVARHGLTIT